MNDEILTDAVSMYREAVLHGTTMAKQDTRARLFDRVLELCVAAEVRGFQKGYEKAQQEVLS